MRNHNDNELQNCQVVAYAAMQKGEPLRPYHYAPQTLSPLDVEVEITHCGLCHTDLHLIENDWGFSSYPLVPGHEIVGYVAQKGNAVYNLEVGQRVGIGWLAGACFACESCASGHENLCARWQPTCVGREGGFATHIQVDGRFAYPIPDTIPSEYAAPLLCGGITVFAPLRQHGVTDKTRLGVVGIGGLGHLALQYGRAIGCHVTAFSSSPDKETEARRFGADAFVATEAAGALADHANTCDFLLSTVSADLPWADYLNVLKPNGKLCIVGVPASAVSLPAFPLIAGQKSVVGSVIGSGDDMRSMLEFSACGHIRPQIELFSMREVNTALARLKRNQVRYRAVLMN